MKFKGILLIVPLVVTLTSCTVSTYHRSFGYGYGYYPRTYYSYQSYPYYNTYYPYGYPYYVNRPIYWQRQSFSINSYYNRVPGNYYRSGYMYRSYNFYRR